MRRKYIDMNYIKECIRCGLSIQSISKATKVSEEFIISKLKEENLTFKDLLDERFGKNIGFGHDCKPSGEGGKHDCKYWSEHDGVCDYILKKGTRRPCPAWDCTCYEKRGRKNGQI